MRNLITIASREIGAYFNSSIFWVLATAFMIFGGLVFSLITTGQSASADMLPLLGLYGTILLFVAPLLAMRLLSEEQRTGTLELLMTAPIRDWQVVWGKWLGALVMTTVILALTIFHVAILVRLATNGIEVGPLISSYIGLFLLAAALLALGVLTSSVTQNQVVAAFLGIMLVMVLWFLPLLQAAFGEESVVGKVMAYAGLSDHYFNFGQGVIDSRDVVYMLSLIVGSLVLATRILESRRWR